MSQSQRGPTAEVAPNSGSVSAGLDVVAEPALSTAVLTQMAPLRPAYQGITHAGSTSKAGASIRGNVQLAANPIGRRVGTLYVWQSVLTTAPLLLADLALLAAVIVAAKYLLLSVGLAPAMDLSACFFPIAAGFVVLSVELGLYPGIRLGPVDEFRRLAVAVTSLFAVWIVGLAVLSSDQLVWNRCIYVLTAYGLYLVGLPMSRGLLRRLLARWSWWGFPTLICGDGVTAHKLHEWLSKNRRLGLRSVGVITEVGDKDVKAAKSDYSIGTWSEAGEVARQKGAFWVVVVPSEDGSTDVESTLAECLNTFPHIHILSELTGLPDHWGPHQQIDGLSGIHLQQNLMLPLPRMMKRLIDLSMAGLGGLVLLPLLFYIAVAVKLSSRGPIIYGHERIGKDGRRFKAWKFRSMFENSHDVLEYFLEQHPELREEWEVDHKLRYDPRVTRIGRFIRKTSLDELPQLWNVMRGEMSLVGPRPIVTAEIVKYGHYYGLYTLVKPGITGLWQVSGRNNTTYDERVQLDAYYVRNWSPWMDLYLLIRTIRIVCFAHGAY